MESPREPLWTLINSFDVETDESAEFIAAWTRARDYMQTQPGFVDAKLHEALAADAEFRFVSIAHWDSVEHFQEATTSPGFRDAAESLGLFSPHPGLYRLVHT
jgi:heme-degrading monooxygenase HmoA